MSDDKENNGEMLHCSFCGKSQPEAKNTLFMNTLISVGLIEAMPIIATVIALIMLYANPLIK